MPVLMSILEHIEATQLKDCGVIGFGMPYLVGVDVYFIQIDQFKPEIWQLVWAKSGRYPPRQPPAKHTGSLCYIRRGGGNELTVA